MLNYYRALMRKRPVPSTNDRISCWALTLWGKRDHMPSAEEEKLLRRLVANWFTRPVQLIVFSLTELIIAWDMYRHRSHPAQSVTHVVLALILVAIWWRAARINARDAYDTVDWFSFMVVSGLALIPDFIP